MGKFRHRTILLVTFIIGFSLFGFQNCGKFETNSLNNGIFYFQEIKDYLSTGFAPVNAVTTDSGIPITYNQAKMILYTQTSYNGTPYYFALVRFTPWIQSQSGSRSPSDFLSITDWIKFPKSNERPLPVGFLEIKFTCTQKDCADLLNQTFDLSQTPMEKVDGDFGRFWLYKETSLRQLDPTTKQWTFSESLMNGRSPDISNLTFSEKMKSGTVTFTKIPTGDQTFVLNLAGVGNGHQKLTATITGTADPSGQITSVTFPSRDKYKTGTPTFAVPLIGDSGELPANEDMSLPAPIAAKVNGSFNLTDDGSVSIPYIGQSAKVEGDLVYGRSDLVFFYLKAGTLEPDSWYQSGQFPYSDFPLKKYFATFNLEFDFHSTEAMLKSLVGQPITTFDVNGYVNPNLTFDKIIYLKFPWEHNIAQINGEQYDFIRMFSSSDPQHLGPPLDDGSFVQPTKIIINQFDGVYPGATYDIEVWGKTLYPVARNDFHFRLHGTFQNQRFTGRPTIVY